MEVERKMAQEENGVLVELLALPLQLGMPVVVVVGRPNLATRLGHCTFGGSLDKKVVVLRDVS